MADVSVTQTSNSVVGASAPAVDPATGLLYREAFLLALAASKAIPLDELLPVNVDVPSAVITASGALPQILALRAQVVEELPKFDISLFDLLETHTLAAGDAHLQFVGASGPPAELIALNEEGTALRDTLYSDAIALSNRGIINGEKLGVFKGATGYKNVAFDLLGLASVLRAHWNLISSKTALQLSELDHADVLGKRMTDAVGAREQAPSVTAEVALQRQRNFTLFSRSYDQIRRALSYLRWDAEDLENIAPSLFAGRGGRGRKDASPSTDVPAPVAGQAATPTAPGGSVPTVATPAASAAKPAASASSGLPGGNPFAGAVG
ncbi:MAG: hypothetical protein ABI548_12735 [Polyangiaceae bacterium]